MRGLGHFLFIIFCSSAYDGKIFSFSSFKGLFDSMSSGTSSSSISLTILAFKATSDSSLLGFWLGSSVSFCVAFFSVIVWVRLSIKWFYLVLTYFLTKNEKGQRLQQPQLTPSTCMMHAISSDKVIMKSKITSTTMIGT